MVTGPCWTGEKEGKITCLSVQPQRRTDWAKWESSSWLHLCLATPDQSEESMRIPSTNRSPAMLCLSLGTKGSRVIKAIYSAWKGLWTILLIFHWKNWLQPILCCNTEVLWHHREPCFCFQCQLCVGYDRGYRQTTLIQHNRTMSKLYVSDG